MTSAVLDINLTGFDDVFGTERGSHAQMVATNLAGTALERLQALGVVDLSEFYDMFGGGIWMEEAEEKLPKLSQKLGLEISVLWFRGDPEIDDDCEWWLAHRGDGDDIAWLPDDFVTIALGGKASPLIDFTTSEDCEHFYRICAGHPRNLVATGEKN